MAAIATPQRPLPGAYLVTPVVTRSNPSGPSAQLRSTSASQSGPLVPTDQTKARPRTETVSEVERAAAKVNNALADEQRYPELDNYITRKYGS